MQIAIIIINLILSVIGLVCIHLKTHTKEKHLANAVKQVIIPGAAGRRQGDGSLVSLLLTFSD